MSSDCRKQISELISRANEHEQKVILAYIRGYIGDRKPETENRDAEQKVILAYIRGYIGDRKPENPDTGR